MEDFEKLGAFYLGRRYDLAGKRRTGDPLQHDSRDLLTHAVCVSRRSRARSRSRSRRAFQTAISVGATVLGALFGRKAISATTIGRATTAARTAGRTMKQAGDVGRAKETVGAVQQQIQELDAELQSELAASQAATDPATERLETVTLRPKKSDVTVRRIALLWRPESPVS
jgi:hypothetical protein